MYKLRELNRKDLITINKWRNSENLISYLGAPFRYIDIEVDQKLYDCYLSNRSNNVRCAIVDNEDSILGLISLLNIDSVHRSAALHIMIGDEDNCNKGIGSFAVTEILNHAFNNLNLNRVELGVLETNDRAIHLYEKIGFVKEGKKREYCYKNGRFVDLYMYSILKKEYNC